MQYAIIDLGSNSVRLCIYEVDSFEPFEFRQIYNKKVMAGLASYLDDHSNLTKPGINRAIEILNSFKRKINNFDNIQSSSLFATAVFRRAQNQEQVIKEIEDKTGFKADVLSGNEEAKIGFVGSMLAFDVKTGVQIDIGGASSEVVYFKNKKIKTAASLHVGSLSLFINNVNDILPTPKEIDDIHNQVMAELNQRIVNQDLKVDELTGVGGSVRAIEKLRNAWFYENVRKPGSTVYVEEIDEILDRVRYDYRGAMRDILRVVPERVHTAIPGIVAARTIIEYFNGSCIHISKYGVREGYLASRVLHEKNLISY